MKKTILVAAVVAVIIIGAIALGLSMGWLRQDGWKALLAYYTDETALAQYIKTFGPYGPIVFIGLQVLQVVAAPIPW